MAIDAKRWDSEYRARRQAAVAQVEAYAEIRRLGGSPSPLPEEILRLASTPSAAESIERILTARREARSLALKEALRPVTGWNDGSHIEEFGPADGTVIRGRYEQVRRHQEMARASAPAGDYLVARAAARAQRAAMYKRMGEAAAR
ncbi:MAG: hypothetical protein ACLP01_08055 [Solirubrobacteraceae bacterium]